MTKGSIVGIESISVTSFGNKIVDGNIDFFRTEHSLQLVLHLIPFQTVNSTSYSWNGQVIHFIGYLRDRR